MYCMWHVLTACHVLHVAFIDCLPSLTSVGAGAEARVLPPRQGGCWLDARNCCNYTELASAGAARFAHPCRPLLACAAVMNRIMPPSNLPCAACGPAHPAPLPAALSKHQWLDVGVVALPLFCSRWRTTRSSSALPSWRRSWAWCCPVSWRRLPPGLAWGMRGWSSSG